MSLLWGYVGFDVPGNCLGKSVSYSVMSDSVTPWTVAYQAPLWNSPGKNTGMSCHSLLQRNLPDPGIEPMSPSLWADSLSSKPP